MGKRIEVAINRVRGTLLAEMEVISGLHRKALIRLKKEPLACKTRVKHRGNSYGPEVDDALVIVENLDYVSAERLTPNLVSLARIWAPIEHMNGAFH